MGIHTKEERSIQSSSCGKGIYSTKGLRLRGDFCSYGEDTDVPNPPISRPTNGLGDSPNGCSDGFS